MRKFSYGRIKDKPDARDFKLHIPHLAPVTKSVYLNPDNGFKVPPVWDQGDIGSCTAFAWAFAVMFDLLNKNFTNEVPADYSPSQLFIYFYERFLQGNIQIDSGAEIRDGAKALNKYGVCSESLFPYVTSRLTVPPPPAAVQDALDYKAIAYYSIDNTNKALVVNALMQGFPIVFGMDCYDSFESEAVNKTSIVPFPEAIEQIIGGHAMAIVGYHMGEGDDDTFIVRNSWGKDYGAHGGYLRIPTRYLCNPTMASDFWVLSLVL